ncbi:hypothetical protein ASG29_15240 [Sphingomonas sp. Leaf412]|uniref:PilZ domain-containing protein n=1 Tax=Sphingomonas sp. Leaf412 TaxID=1736370 RepID=UPI0007021CEB|nr:PilZ domain-containing protein [Sphingomonas sp. Leaf412]KQT31312.1 hypothetical protein ASG29_15240 [Sphingomonas sp. Leaf412]
MSALPAMLPAVIAAPPVQAPLPAPAAGDIVHDRRSGPRARTHFAIGKLTVDGCEHVCIVRNQSAQGVGIEMDCPPAAGTRVGIEARSLLAADATVIWSHDGMAGLRLDAPLVPPPADLRPRSPRFAVARSASLIVEDRVRDVPLRDISLGGVRLGGHVPSGMGTLVVLLLGPYSLPGRICWHAAGMSGVRFTRPLAASELAAILAWVDRPSP